MLRPDDDERHRQQVICAPGWGLPACDAQVILGHTRISTTLEIYANVYAQARLGALSKLHSLLGEHQG
jgi:hypothetical protein